MKEDVERLLKAGIITNTNRGYVNSYGERIGYYKTSGGTRYIEDAYVHMLKNGLKGEN
ncbi:MAG: hypothetical protein ACI4DS_00790 [Eubacterium sp.]